MTTKLLALMLLTVATAISSTGQTTSLPAYEIRQASPFNLPGGRDASGRILNIDCNSPVEWDDDGNIFLFTSTQHPYRSSGPDLFSLDSFGQAVVIDQRADILGGKWLEATYRAEDGTLYGWYHNEPPSQCGNSRLTAPRIGALISRDDGRTWKNLGLIIEAPAGSLFCDTRNFYFAGGNGDFSVILDQDKQYFYFFISTYYRQFSEQGIAVARMRYEDRDNPVGKVWKWRAGAWNEQGLGGHVTTTFPALVDWHQTNANAYWGPSVHYNTYLETYVVLLNHAIDRNWSQEGIYISFNGNLADPHGWSAPERLPIYSQFGWYPQVIGLETGQTDKTASQIARLFTMGRSYWEIVFQRTDGDEAAPPSIPLRPPPKPRGDPIVRQVN